MLPVAQAQQPSNLFKFGVMGDMPYRASEVPQVDALIADFNQQPLSFVLHVGDLKDGSNEKCTDELYTSRKKQLNTSHHSLIVVPGDNDWTDCRRDKAGGYDPVERLQRFREIMYPDEWSLGYQPIKLTRQSDGAKFKNYRENVRWEHQQVLFVGMNVPGSNNHYRNEGGRNGEFEDRWQANKAWLKQAFQVAHTKNLPAIVIFWQANPLFETAKIGVFDWMERAHYLKSQLRNKRDGYQEIKHLLAELTDGYDGQVLLIHGDTHQFKHDHPLQYRSQPLPRFTRIETYGSPWMYGLVVTVSLNKDTNKDSTSPAVQFKVEIRDEALRNKSN
jgi:hypothetical protein